MTHAAVREPKGRETPSNLKTLPALSISYLRIQSARTCIYQAYEYLGTSLIGLRSQNGAGKVIVRLRQRYSIPGYIGSSRQYNRPLRTNKLSATYVDSGSRDCITVMQSRCHHRCELTVAHVWLKIHARRTPDARPPEHVEPRGRRVALAYPLRLRR